MKRKEHQTALSSSHLKIEKDDEDYAVSDAFNLFTQNRTKQNIRKKEKEKNKREY